MECYKYHKKQINNKLDIRLYNLNTNNQDDEICICYFAKKMVIELM